MTRLLALALFFTTLLPAQTAGKVVVIGYDGMSAAGLAQANAPAITNLRQSGAWTFHARAVLPTVSSPNWASMIMGATPAQHGVTSNEWQPDRFTIAPACHGIAPTFPTIFGLLRDQRPGAEIAIFHQWKDFARLVEPAAPTIVRRGADAADTVQQAVTYLGSHQPDLLFVHLDSVDEALHHAGHLTPQYLAAIAEADRLTGMVLAALDRNGMRAHTVVLLTADHGGAGKKHGGESMTEIEIPWIMAGPGVRAGVELRGPVNTFDTAATIAHILGMKPPACWIGRPVTEALE